MLEQPTPIRHSDVSMYEVCNFYSYWWYHYSNNNLSGVELIICFNSFLNEIMCKIL